MTIIVARIDADAADMLISDADERDHEFMTGERRGAGRAVCSRGPRLAYNCSPSFNWKGRLDDDEIAGFQAKLGELGYALKFITLAGFHSEGAGYSAVKHQHEVGASCFEEVALAITGGESETTSVKGSTEESQFSRA